jgi:hypothetical protein
MDNIKKMLLSVFVLAVCALLAIAPVYADQDSAQNAISSAQSNVKDCYLAVRQAEAAGANVDSLLVSLNDAAGLLSKAQLSYSGKDYDTAYTYAVQCQSQLGDLITQANVAKVNANGNAAGLVFEALSLGLSVGLVCAGVAAWVVLGKKQGRSQYTTASV